MMDEITLNTVLMLTRRIREMKEAIRDSDEISDALKVHGELHSMSRNGPAVRVDCTFRVVNCLDPINKPVTTIQFKLPPGIAWDLLYGIVMDMRKLAESKLKGLVDELAKYVKE
jgi:hypothetical protein